MPTATVILSADMETDLPNISPDTASGIADPTIFHLFAVEAAKLMFIQSISSTSNELSGSLNRGNFCILPNAAIIICGGIIIGDDYDCPIFIFYHIKNVCFFTPCEIECH